MNIAAKPQDHIAAFRLDIPDHTDVIKGELAQRGDWIVANIATTSFWPVTAQKVRWRGVDIWIMPIMKGFYPAVAIMVPPEKSREECEELVMRFMSMLSWVEEKGFSLEFGGFSGGSLPPGRWGARRSADIRFAVNSTCRISRDHRTKRRCWR